MGQTVDWSDVTVRYPSDLMDSTETGYAETGAIFYPDMWNRLNRTVRLMQEHNLAVYQIRTGMSDAEIQAVLNEAKRDPGSKIEFQPGEYSTNSDFYIDSLLFASIEGNGAHWDANNQLFVTTTYPDWDAQIIDDPVTYPNAQQYIWFDTGIDTIAFTTDISQDSFWVGIDDPSDWGTINYGDLLIFGDTTEVGQTFIFDYIDTLAGPTYRIYFQKAAMNNILTNRGLEFGGSKLAMSRKVNCANKHLTINNLTVENLRWDVTGFESVQISNLNFFTDTTGYSTDIPVAAMYLLYNKNIQVNNYTVNNYYYSSDGAGGSGYGLALGYYDEAQITNFYAYNCRHALTTITSNFNYNGRLKMTNAHAYLPYSTNKLASGFDTHKLAYYTEFINCTAENVANGFNIRGNSASFINCAVRNSNAGINVQNADVGFGGKKDNLIINGFVGENTPAFMQLDALCGDVRRIDINNVLWRTDENSAGVFFKAKDTMSIDTLFFRNIEIKGSVNGTQLFNNVSNVSGTMKINYVEFDNVKMDSAQHGIVQDSIEIAELYVHDSQFNNMTYFHLGNDLDTSSVNRRWKFYNNKFKNISKIIATSYMQRWELLEFEENEFDDMIDSPYNLQKLYVDTLRSVGNKFTGAYTNFDAIVYLRYPAKINEFYSIGDIVYDNGANLEWVDCRSDTTLLNPDVANFHFIDGKWFARASRIFDFDNVDFEVMGNHLNPISMDNTDEEVFYIDSASTGKIVNNDIYIKNASNALVGISINNASNDVLIDQNRFYKTGSTIGGNFPIKSTAGTVTLGENYYDGFGGNQNDLSSYEYRPQTYYNTWLDSIKIYGDTLRFYEGENIYKAGKARFNPDDANTLGLWMTGLDSTYLNFTSDSVNYWLDYAGDIDTLEGADGFRPTWSPSTHSIQFDSTDVLKVDDSTKVTLGTSDFTIAGYVKVATPTTTLCGRWDVGGASDVPVWELKVNSDFQIGILLRDTTSGLADFGLVSAGKALNDGNYHSFAVVADRDTDIKVYVDGVLISSDNSATWTNWSVIDFPDSANVFSVGDLYAGVADRLMWSGNEAVEVWVSDKARTLPEIKNYHRRCEELYVDETTYSGTEIQKFIKVGTDFLIITATDTFVIDSVRAK